MKVGDRARFTLYGEYLGIATIEGRAGSSNESYQWFIKLDDGREFVAKAKELEKV